MKPYLANPAVILADSVRRSIHDKYDRETTKFLANFTDDFHQLLVTLPKSDLIRDGEHNDIALWEKIP